VLIGTNFPATAELSSDLKKKVSQGLDHFSMIATAGLDYIEFGLRKTNLNAEMFRADVKRLHELGLKLNIHPYYECRGFGTPSESSTLRQNIEQVFTIARDAAQYEGRPITLNFHAASGNNHRQEMIEQSQQFNTWLVETADRLDADVIITTEHQLPPRLEQKNLQRIGDNFDELLTMVQATPHDNFGSCWDMGHSVMQHVQSHANVMPPQKYPTMVKHIHIHDVDFKIPKDHRLISTGQSPLANYLALLPTYDGSITMEYSASEFFDIDYVEFLQASKTALMALLP